MALNCELPGHLGIVQPMDHHSAIRVIKVFSHIFLLFLSSALAVTTALLVAIILPFDMIRPGFGFNDFLKIFPDYLFLGHMLAFPGLIIYGAFAMKLYGMKGDFALIILCSTTLALINGIIVVQLFGGYGLGLVLVPLKLLVTFYLTGFFTGCYHYFFLRNSKNLTVNIS